MALWSGFHRKEDLSLVVEAHNMRDMGSGSYRRVKKETPSGEGWKYTAEELKSISEEINDGLSSPSGLLED